MQRRDPWSGILGSRICYKVGVDESGKATIFQDGVLIRVCMGVWDSAQCDSEPLSRNKHIQQPTPVNRFG